MSKVYIITREEGSYSDYSMEIVKAVATQAQAEHYIDHYNTVEKIKSDKSQEIWAHRAEWFKQNPGPVRPNLHNQTDEVQNWSKLNLEHYGLYQKTKEDFVNALVEENYESYKDKNIDCPDVTYSFEEMEVEDGS